VTILIVLAAAFLLGLGFVLQQRAAQQAPPDELLSYRLLLDLVRKPVWLAGIASMVGGQVLGAVALGKADVTLVEPLLTANLLFALALARLVSAQALGRREWSGAALLILGIAVFVIAGDPRAGQTTLHNLQAWLVVGGIGCLAALLVAVARRRPGPEKATLLAAAAGALFGLQDGFTRRAMTLLDEGVAHLLASWQIYAVVGVAIVGILLAQSAFEAAPLKASLPAMTVAEPLCGMAFGVGAFGEVVRVAPVWLGLESAGLLAMVTGVIMLGRSPHLHRHLTTAAQATPQC
jgi:drug/metabolite transporter (DMT)-like permease